MDRRSLRKQSDWASLPERTSDQFGAEMSAFVTTSTFAAVLRLRACVLSDVSAVGPPEHSGLWSGTSSSGRTREEYRCGDPPRAAG